MEYYFSKILNISIDEAVNRVTEALKDEGFGIVSRIDMHDKFKEKLGVDFKKYIILGACNPPFAYKALQAEDKIGAMLPCNVVVQEKGDNQIEVAAIEPMTSMQAVGNPSLATIASEITAKLHRVVDGV